MKNDRAINEPEHCIMRRGTAILIAAALVILSCTAENPSVPSDGANVDAVRSYPQKGILHDLSFTSWDAAKVRDASEADMLIFPVARCFSPDAQDIIAELKRLNPSTVILGKHTILGVNPLWPDTNYLQVSLPYEMEYYETVENDWSYTTAGDTLMLWRDIIFLKPIIDGELNRRLIVDLLDLMERYQIESGNVLDGVVYDYLMQSLYINYAIRDIVEGEPDLDSDGIPFIDDPEEAAYLIQWQKEYINEFRIRFGDDFILVANGHLPQDDAEIAGMLNGLFFEAFPNNLRSYTDREGLLRLLQFQEEGYLRKARGRTWTILTNVDGGQNNLFCCIASMIAGCFYAELHGTSAFTGWTLDINAGKPRSEYTMEGDVDGVLTVRRAFSHGEARISFITIGARWIVTFDEDSILGD